MPDSQVIARHFATAQPVRLKHSGGRITQMEAAPSAPENLWIAPTLVDLQVNGYGGVDFQQDSVSASELERAALEWQASGCSEILLTLITRSWPALLNQLKQLKNMRDQSPTLRAAIAGWHVEGPFLSPEPGFHGAHNPKAMLDPTPEQIQELRAATGSDPLMLTMAPEHSNALRCIAFATSLSIKISLGHTNASAEQIKGAIAAGATGFTHLGNGIPQQLDRHDNILWRVFDNPGLTAGIIPDKIHVSPQLFRIFHKQLGSEHIYYTTDAMAAAGAPPGNYTIGDLTLTVGADQIVRYPGRSNFAGSALRPIDGIRRAAKMLNCRWQDVWKYYSDVPRRLMQLGEGLEIQRPANFCVIECGKSGEIKSGQVFVHGKACDLKL